MGIGIGRWRRGISSKFFASRAPSGLGVTISPGSGLVGTTFQASVTGDLGSPAGPPVFQWKLNGANISGAASATYVSAAAGSLTVQVSVSNRVGTAGPVTSSAVTVASIDTTPAAFTFAGQTGVALGATITSDTLTITGINSPAPISITGGSFRILSAANVVVADWRTASSTITSGQKVHLRLTSSSANSTTSNATLTIGGVSDTWSVATVAAADTTPTAFTFTDQTGVALGAVISSDTLTIAGIDAAAAVSITGGEYRITSATDALVVDWTSSAGTITVGQKVRLRLTSSGSNSTAKTATLTIGGVSDTWSVTTGAFGALTPTTGTGLVADGATDNSSAFAAWFNGHPGQELILQPGATYRADSRVYTGTTVNLKLNGATILAPKGFLQNWIRTTISAATYGTGSAGAVMYTASAGATSLIAPSTGIAVGDVCSVWSDGFIDAAGSYRDGCWIKITAISGGVMTFTPAIPVDMPIRYMIAYKPLASALVGPGTIDMRGGGEYGPTGDTNNRSGLMMWGDSVHIQNLTLLGDLNCERGILAEGRDVLVEGCTISGFSHDGGLGSGRMGYGIDVGGVYAEVAGNIVSNCKHCITSATSRDYRANHVIVRDNTVSSPAGEQSVNVTVNGTAQPKWQGMIDGHGSCRLMEIRGNTISGVNSAITARCPIILDDNIITISGATTSYAMNYMVNVSESPMNISGSGNSFTSTASDGWAVGLQAFSSVMPPSGDHGNLVLDDTALSGVSLFTVAHNNNNTLPGITIGNVEFTNVSGSGVDGVKIIGNATYPIGGIGSVELTGPATFSGSPIDIQYVTGYDEGDPVLGSDILTNGDFGSSTGWTLAGTGGAAAASISGGVLNLTGDDTNTGYASQAVAVTSGATYRLTWTTASAAASFRVGSAFLGQQMAVADNRTGTGFVDFTATGTTAHVSIRRQAAGAATIAAVSLSLAA